MNISEGIQYNFSAISFLARNPNLWIYCVIPFFVSVFVMIGTIYSVFLFFDYISIGGGESEEIKIIGIASFLKFLWSWTVVHLGLWMKWIFFIVFSLVIIWYGYGIIASLVMLPFLELLSCRVEEKLRGISNTDNAWYVGLMSSLLFSLSFTVLKIIFMIIFLILGLMFPPIIILSFIITAWFCSMEALDLSMSRRLFTFKQKLEFFKGKRKMMVGVGSLSALLLMIPFIQVFQPILSAIAGTMYWVDQTPEYGLLAEDRENN
ncbi:MAG: hypothetical protein COA79_19665 [Planctomycetota bacterium]|nr:MAG: hypothetical protein COA79_19665 [Planctomycetota bacterium]